jgi:glycosyltransferase involved in cell wall biosynthesis
MRFHLPGLAHTITNKDFCHCAFTQKVYKLSKMLTSLGHEVYHYGCEGGDPICTEHVDVIEDSFRKKFYPDEWHDKQWDFDVQDECHQEFYQNTISAIKERQQDRDFFLASWGWGHKSIADAVGNMIVVEPGIGYKDTFSTFRVFESYNWMSYVYGYGKLDKDGKRAFQNDGAFFDAVIPNYFDSDDFDYTPDKKEDYFLYLGRMIKRKGIHVATDIIKAVGGHLKLAGQGSFTNAPSTGGEIIEYVGFADVEKRRQLLSKAKALIMPTLYIEPFGGVAIEAMLSGTPVISSDWGVFPETVLHGVTGYRCRTLEQFCWAARNIDNISPEVCRKWALENFSIERVGQMYQEYFEMVSTLWNKSGWYTLKPRSQMNWLNKNYPQVTPQSEQFTSSAAQVIDDVISPDEYEAEFALDLSWYKKDKKDGISFLLRAKNEQKTIGLALDSLNKLEIPYEVNVVLNQCTDDTEKEVQQRLNGGQNINIFQYPFQLGKTGLENQCTPVTSVHSTIWLLNWMLMKGNYTYTFRWDADFIMTAQLAEEVQKNVAENTFDIYNIPAIFSDSGKPNVEPYLWSNNNIPRYARYSVWHIARFAKSQLTCTTLKGTIVHDSPLSTSKSYWETSPWWENQDNKEVEEKYEKLKSLLGDDCSTIARASCPSSEELARKIQGITGADTEEIPLLRRYALLCLDKGI